MLGFDLNFHSGLWFFRNSYKRGYQVRNVTCTWDGDLVLSHYLPPFVVKDGVMLLLFECNLTFENDRR